MKSEHMSTLFCCVYVGKFLHSLESSAGLLSRSVQFFVRTPCALFTHVFTFYKKNYFVTYKVYLGYVCYSNRYIFIKNGNELHAT